MKHELVVEQAWKLGDVSGGFSEGRKGGGMEVEGREGSKAVLKEEDTGSGKRLCVEPRERGKCNECPAKPSEANLQQNNEHCSQ